MNNAGKGSTTVGKWTGAGLALGAAFGNPGVGVALGLVVGAAMGAAINRRSPHGDPPEMSG